MAASTSLRLHAAVLIAAFLSAGAQSASAQQPATTPPDAIAPMLPPQAGGPLQSAQEAEIAANVPEWDEALTRIGSELEESAASTEVSEAIRSQLEDMRARILVYIAEQRPRLQDLEARLQSLGEAPAEGEPPEPQPVAVQRAELRTLVGSVKGGLKAAESALVRIDALSARAREIRRATFERQIFERGRSPLSPYLWLDIARDAPFGLTRIRFMLSHWWENVRSGPLFLAFLIAAMAIWAGLYYISFRRVVHLREWSDSDPPSEWRRAASAGRVILLRLLPIVAASAFLYFGLTASDLLSSTAARIILTGIASLVIIATVQGVTKTTLAITRPQWRLLNLSDRAARQLYKYLMILSVVYGADFFISAVSQAAFMPFSVNLGQSFVSSVLIAGLIISILRIKENGGDGAAPRPIGRAYIRLPLWLIALTILGAAMIGYVSFARFIAGQLIVTSTILIVTYLLFISASAFGQGMSDEKSIMGARLRDDLGFDKSVRERLALPVMLILKAAIIIAAVPLVLLLWGFDWYDIGSWLRQALFGFEIGGVTLSITSVLIAMLLFIVGYIAARFFQDWLDGSVLKTAGVDPGVRDSVRTGVGYLGVGLAALLAVSYLGLSFSNIAIVAGALSVGIGFGLQSIVNNFVSGLILLAERPIKAGDWIIVGSHEGIVRKISVRSTEIETFDRANVIVPNSMLISDTVKNWTLHNSTGRMPIPVGVHYDSDPERVREILLGVARDHPAVLSNPAPFVFFEGFGDSALNFILFVYLSNVNQSFSVRTDLRIAILKAFRQHGVEIPYPQTDVHLRDLDWVKEALKNRRIGRDDGADVKRRDYKAESQEPDTDAADSDGQ